MGIRIAPSILSADLARIADEVRAVETAGADLIHVDVMDGRFVPNLTFGPAVVKSLRAATKLPLDVHLMIVEPERYIEDYARSGADILVVHAEASVHLHRTIQQIVALGKRPGVALNPHTPLDVLDVVLGDLSSVLIMTVNPGFAGQAFIEAVVPKIRKLRDEIDRRGLKVEIAVDGGVAPGTASRVTEAGATTLVAGAAIYGKPDYRAAITAIRADAERGWQMGVKARSSSAA